MDQAGMDPRQSGFSTREKDPLKEIQEMDDLQARLNALQSAYTDSNPIFQLLGLAFQAVDLARRMVESRSHEPLQEVPMIRVQVADITYHLEEAELYAQLT